MPQPRRASGEYYVIPPTDDTGMLLTHLNSIFGRLTARLNQLEGHNGTPTFHSALDVRGQRIMNVATPTAPSDAVPNSMALTLVPDAQHPNNPMQWDANGLQIFNLGDGNDRQDSATVGQIQAMMDEAAVVNAGTYVTLATTQTITGQKTFDRDPSAPFVVSSGSANVTNLDADKWDGKDYEEGTFTGTGTGFTASITATCRYVKAGNLVVLYLDTIAGTSNATTFTITGVPAAIQPTRQSHHAVLVQDNGVDMIGWLRLDIASGTILLIPAPPAVNWTNAGAKALYRTQVAYNLV